jgi:hypothetical protein
MKPKFEYKLIFHREYNLKAHREVNIYSYVITDLHLSLEPVDHDSGTPATLWIGDNTKIEFEDDVELVKIREIK